MQPKDVRRNTRNYKKCKFEISSFQGDKAKKKGCTNAHLLSNGELETMKKNSAVVILVMKPYYLKLGNGKLAKEIYWTVVGKEVLPTKLTISLIKPCMIIVTTYDQVQHDERF